MSLLRTIARKIGLGRLRLWFNQKINFTCKAEINGIEICIPNIGGVSCQVSEPWMTDLLQKLLAIRKGAFLDVGVNLGQTLLKVKALDNERKYVGFEPNPSCVYYSQELIESNHFKECSILPVGLFTENSILALDIASESKVDSTASLIRDFRPGQKVHSQIFVPVFNFSSCPQTIQNTDFGIVKIDVEGAEVEVVKSLQKVFNDLRPVVLMEILPVYSDSNLFRLKRQEELEKLFSALNYKFLRVTKTKDNTYSGLQLIEKIETHSSLDLCDYVIAPQEMLDRLDVKV